MIFKATRGDGMYEEDVFREVRDVFVLLIDFLGRVGRFKVPVSCFLLTDTVLLLLQSLEAVGSNGS